MRIGKLACHNFGIFNWPKRIQTPNRLFLLAIWQIVWQSLSNAIPDNNQMLLLQNQWQSSWGSTLAQLGRVRQASTNTWCFWVCGSCCRQRPASVRKKVLLLTAEFWSQKIWMLCKFLAAFTTDLIWNKSFSCETRILMYFATTCYQPK